MPSVQAETADRLQHLVQTILGTEGYELFDLRTHQHGRQVRIEILADKPYGGITIEECTRLNRRITQQLEQADFCPSDYTLAFSSPGTDWPLRGRREFLRIKDKKVRIILRQPINEKRELIGQVMDAADESVTIACDGSPITVLLTDIQKATQYL